MTPGLGRYLIKAETELRAAIVMGMSEEEAQQRLMVAEGALRKVNSRYQPRARKTSWDCATILADTFQEAGAIREVANEEIPFYRRDFAQHSPRQYYLETLERWAKKVSRRRGYPGDVALFDFGLSISHSAIVITWPVAVHAWADSNMVEMSEINQAPLPARRLSGIWSVWAFGDRGGW